MSELALTRPGSGLAAPSGPSAGAGSEIAAVPLASPLTRGGIMIGRCLRLGWRNTDAVITSLVLPVALMLMFVYLFGGAIRTGTAYVTYVVPGVLVLCAGFGSALTAVRVCEDMNGGIVDRLVSMNVGGAAIVTGHVVASTIRNAVSSALVLGVAFAIGFRPHAGAAAWLAAAGLLIAFIVAVSAVSAVIGLLVRSPEAANGCTFVLLFLPYPSSAFVPIATMPTWIRGFARHQPATPVIGSIRALLLSHPLGGDAWVALAWCGGILLAAAAASVVAFQRRVSRA
jgi:ABC-2 type transport system permease protein